MVCMVTEKGFQRLSECRCRVISRDSLARTLGCCDSEAKSIMFLTNNVFYEKRRCNHLVLVAKRTEILQVLRNLLKNGGHVPRKSKLEYPRNLICTLFCGDVPSWLEEQSVLEAVSRLSPQGKVLVESLYCEEKGKRQIAKQFGIKQEEFKVLEQACFKSLLQDLTRREKKVSTQELLLTQRTKNCLQRADYLWSSDLVRDYKENKKRLLSVRNFGPKSLKEIGVFVESLE